MFELIRRSTRTELLIHQLSVLAAALAIAELFYKFHSFLLESIACLATWFVLDGLRELLMRAVSRTRRLLLVRSRADAHPLIP